jgi:hypothetical protein
MEQRNRQLAYRRGWPDAQDSCRGAHAHRWLLSLAFWDLYRKQRVDAGAGQEKYFCEIDCHIAYAVIGVKKLLLVGASADTTAARGIFYVVTVRTRFDEKTISPSRGDSPLEPSPRAILLVDGAGRAYSPSFAGGRILEVIGESGVPMTQQLRPGESYHTRVAFDVPRDARNLRLLIESPTQPGWIGKSPYRRREQRLP